MTLDPSANTPERLDTTRITAIAVGSLASGAWYALPDFVRSRGARTLIKGALLGAMGWSACTQLPAPAELEPYEDERVDCSSNEANADPLDDVTEASSTELAILAGAVLASAALTVGMEKYLFRRGERARAAGKRYAHTRQGVVLGALTSAVSLACTLRVQ